MTGPSTVEDKSLPNDSSTGAVQLVAPQLAIIVPTFNERLNIVSLLERLRQAAIAVPYEVIFVDDDSSDGTAQLIREIGQSSPNVRVIHRIGRRGLASACLEGMQASSARYLAVMDADLQHDETILPKMVTEIRSGNYDLVIGSRNIESSGMGEFSRDRVALSNLGLAISRLVSKHALSDPMSGFFVLTREFLNRVIRNTTGLGFKILLDLVASSPSPVRFAEVPYTFRSRQHGTSKLDINVGIEYLYLIVDKLMGGWVPVRFVLFCLVGLTGLALHLSVLWLFYRVIGTTFSTALITAIAVAIVTNYLINNTLTYRDRRRRGWGIIAGLLLYAAACSVGSVSNIALAEFLVARGVWWPVAAFSGLAVASVWNFAATSMTTWRPQRARV